MRKWNETGRGMPGGGVLFFLHFFGRRCRRCTAFLLAALLLFAASADGKAADAPEEVGELYAKSAVLMDAESGRVLEEKDGDTMRPMASTTKILTCILALEEGNPEDLVRASAEAAAQPKVHLGMKEGETFRLDDLLYSLMLESHNDSAVAIAEHLCGSVPAFAARMNEKAREIGCERAHFVTPNGLDGADEGGAHRISAADLARIMSYCVEKSPQAEAFLEITQAQEHRFSDGEGTRTFSCRNHNLFLAMMDGAISGKTGFTGDAGYCYVGALRRDGKTFVVALLACGWPNNKNYKWADTKKLMNYGLEQYEYRDVEEAAGARQAAKIPVAGGVGEKGGLFEEARVLAVDGEKTEQLRVLLKDGETVTRQEEVEGRLTAPVKKGQKVGTARYFLEGELVGERTLLAAADVEKKDYLWIVWKMFEMLHQFQITERG